MSLLNQISNSARINPLNISRNSLNLHKIGLTNATSAYLSHHSRQFSLLSSSASTSTLTQSRKITPALPLTQSRILQLSPIQLYPKIAFIRLTSTTTAAEPQKRGAKALLKEYGPLAIVLYTTLSFTVFVICFTSITLLGIDETKIRWIFESIKGFFGMKSKSKNNQPETEEETKHRIEELEVQERKEVDDSMKSFKGWFSDPRVVQFATNVLLAMAMTKLFVPVKLGLTAMLVPGFARRMRAWGFDLGGKWKDAANTAKDKMNARAAARAEQKDN